VSREVVELGRLHQVDGDEFGAEVGQRAEQLQIPGQRQPREIDLQKLRVAATIAGTVKHRVGVMENVFGGQAAWKILRFHLRYVKPHFRGFDLNNIDYQWLAGHLAF